MLRCFAASQLRSFALNEDSEGGEDCGYSEYIEYSELLKNEGEELDVFNEEDMASSMIRLFTSTEVNEDIVNSDVAETLDASETFESIQKGKSVEKGTGKEKEMPQQDEIKIESLAQENVREELRSDLVSLDMYYKEDLVKGLPLESGENENENVNTQGWDENLTDVEKEFIDSIRNSANGEKIYNSIRERIALENRLNSNTNCVVKNNQTTNVVKLSELFSGFKNSFSGDEIELSGESSDSEETVKNEGER